MASRPYNNIKYIYTTDLGQEKLKLYRQFKDEDTDQPLLSLTVTFLSAIVGTNIKVGKLGKNERLRALRVYVDLGNFDWTQQTVPMPFNDADSITRQTQENSELPKFLCADYLGENSGSIVL